MVVRRAELGLGTAQFGLDSGVSDARGRVPEDEVRQLLDHAACSQVGLIDTAAQYGDAERVLGKNWPFPSPFKVVTKTVRLSEGLDRLEARARRSLQSMGLARAHALLVHSAEDLLGPEGRELWARLQKLKDEGLFQKIGISAYAAEEPVLLARRYKPDLMQLPVSLLDQRLVKDGTLETLAGMGVEIHLRSVFLQGLLFLPRDGLPAGLADAGPRLSRIRRTLAEAGADPMQAALAFALDRPEASAAIVGVTSAAELRAVLAAACAPSPKLDWSALALDHPRALDPRLWASAPPPPARLSTAA
ncbi:aldo/keto reductase [Caulobacter sp. 17J65-9]|uniref:aldo/keto reductase n=1 Tax=Caulobacter sp. 17J65-9 TaxID=2709382 RepID=UPI0013C98C3A|nr:aldo/keto reductase [Caulobacter sp. 17J65-9]NEX94743.1 aldo/keto reductase [Caulobacter sp. 17J65-9]